MFTSSSLLGIPIMLAMSGLKKFFLILWAARPAAAGIAIGKAAAVAALLSCQQALALSGLSSP